MSKTKFPARLHVIFARDAGYAIILRRGPSKSVCSIGWNLNDNTLEVGQWLHGTIDFDSCDLSPDGKHFIYSASRGQPRGNLDSLSLIHI